MKQPKKTTWKQYAKSLEKYVEYLKSEYVAPDTIAQMVASQPDSYVQIVEKVKEYGDLIDDDCAHIGIFGDTSASLCHWDDQLIHHFQHSTPDQIIEKMNELIQKEKACKNLS